MAVAFRGLRLRHAFAPGLFAGFLALSLRSAEARDLGTMSARVVPDSSSYAYSMRPIEDSLRGRSGKLRARLLGQSTLTW
jgi:hypothetical protein